MMFSVERTIAHLGYCNSLGCNKLAGKRVMGVPQDVHRPVLTPDMPENAAELEGEVTFMKLLSLLVYIDYPVCTVQLYL